MACTYNFIDENGIKQALSEDKFSAYLNKRMENGAYASIPNDAKLFSIDRFQGSVSIADSIRSEFSGIKRSKDQLLDPDDDPDKIHNWKGYIGTTTFIGSRGNPKTGIENPIITPFDVEAWRSKQMDILLLDKYTRESAAELIGNIEDTWTQLQKYGDIIHSIYESIFNDVEPNKQDIDDNLYDSIVQQAKDFKQSLINKYGGRSGNVKFYPELTIASKELDPDLKTLLNTEGINQIGGIIDLLVIDSDGKPHIFDYKTSRKRLVWNTNNATISDDEWSSAKQLTVQNQLAAYNAILQQYGFESADCFVVPIKLNLTYSDKYKSRIIGINSIVQNDPVYAPNTSNGNIYSNWKVLVPTKIDTSAEEVIDIVNKHKSLFPLDHISSTNLQQFTATVEYYRKNIVKEVPKEDTKHYGAYKYRFYKTQATKKGWEYAKDEDDLTAKLQKYVDLVNQHKSQEMQNLADTIKRSLSGDISLDDFASDYGLRHQNFLKIQFGRYITDGWNLESNDNLINMGIFLFRKAGQSEIVVVSKAPIHDRLNLGLGTTILGKFIEDEYTNSKTVLPGTNGAIEGMKAMIYISSHPELFANDKISQLSVINPWFGQRTNYLGSDWVQNYNSLVEKSGEGSGLKKVSESLFYDDIPSLLSLVDSYLGAIGESSVFEKFSIDGKDANGDLIEYTDKYIETAIDTLKKRHNFLINNESGGDASVTLAYNYLWKARLAIKGIKAYDELESHPWLSSGFKTGVLVSAPGYSNSTNFRVFDDVMQQYALELRLAVYKQGTPFLSAMDKFYSEKGRPKIIGGEADYYLNWFRRDAQGNIDHRFLLKDPECGDFSGAEKQAIDAWLKTMAELRIRKPNMTDEEFEQKIQEAKADLSYYFVPLTEAAFSRQVKGQGLLKTIKDKWLEARELTEDVFAGKTEEKQNWRKTNPYELYNKFAKDPSDRQKLIDEHGGVGFFETNLEDVLNQALVAYNKTRLSRKFIPIFDGMRIAMRVNKEHGGAQMEETIKNFDKLINSKFYGESIVDQGLQPYMKWIQTLKSFFSKLQLGFNFRSFFREIFQGTWMGLSRSGIEQLPGINSKTYVDGAIHVVTQAHKNFSNVSLLQQLNSQYGMANYSINQIARQRRKNWYGIRNFRSDTLFLTSSSPDFQHRMAILVAKMMGDGCWSAHKLNEKTGLLEYDWENDERFKVYRSGDVSDKRYLDQKTNYLQRIAELNRVGFTKEDGTAFVEGDPLPMAYTPREIQAIRNYADLLYGHYDDESKSLMNDMLLGSMFLQYKTYTTSRVEQWAMTPGIYNTELLQFDKDPTGEQLYKVHKGLDEYGMPDIEIMTRAQIDQNAINGGKSFDDMIKDNEVETSMSWKGIPMEGMGRSYVKFVKDILHLNWEDLRKKWNNPIERDNILIGLHDCLLMSLMMMLVTILFGLTIDGEVTTDTQKVARAMQKKGWGASFMYNVAYGSFQDFPFWQTIGSMFGDLNPTVVVSAKRLVQNTGNVITGDKTIMQALTNTIGAAADLRGWANKLAEAAENI